MSIYKGTELLAGVATNTIENAHSLLDFKWTDHILNELSWLRADTFSWQSGAVYVGAYNHILADYNGGTSQTETVGSYTITYVLADDGHKITADETTVANIYAESGVAWYYILDTVNTRFKLPRTKHGFVGLRDDIGGFVSPGLPNITGYTAWAVNGVCANAYSVQSSVYNKSIGALYATKDGGAYGAIGAQGGDSVSSNTAVNIDASRSNYIYGNSTTVQPPATQMYLYFYVGNFSQSATEQTAGLNASLFNGKADTDLNNVSAGIDFVVESKYPTSEDPTWYRLYKSGWVEQGGVMPSTSGDSYNKIVNLPIRMSDTNYVVIINNETSSNANTNLGISSHRVKTQDSFQIWNNSSYLQSVSWEVKGMSAQS